MDQARAPLADWPARFVAQGSLQEIRGTVRGRMGMEVSSMDRKSARPAQSAGDG